MDSQPNLSYDATADDLFVVMQQTFTEDPAWKFVWAVNAAPELAVVVATDAQLHNLAHFCTSSFEFSVLTVDPTFSLGDFDVTLVTFYSQSDYSNLQWLLVQHAFTSKKSLVGQCRELEGVRAIGTDWKRP